MPVRPALFAVVVLLTASARADKLDLPPPPDQLTTKRLDFRGGAPLVPVRLMEGHNEVTLSSRGGLQFHQPGAANLLVDGPPGTQWRVRRVAGTPAAVVARIQVAELPFNDKDGLKAAQAEWTERGLALTAGILGGVYGIEGKVIDNRRYVLIVDQPPAPPQALAAQQADLLAKFQVRTSLLEEVKTKGTVRFEVLDAQGVVHATVDDQLVAEVARTARPIEVRRVEYGVGYDFHDFEDRSVPWVRCSSPQTAQGQDRRRQPRRPRGPAQGPGPVGDFRQGPPRGAQGPGRDRPRRGPGQDWPQAPRRPLCALHRAALRGLPGRFSGETPTTNARRRRHPTAKHSVSAAADHLVDSVYSAVCGGHTEDNDVVWGGVAKPIVCVDAPTCCTGQTRAPDFAPSQRLMRLPDDTEGALRL
jgi:stage II sporulation protein D